MHFLITHWHRLLRSRPLRHSRIHLYPGRKLLFTQAGSVRVVKLSHGRPALHLLLLPPDPFFLAIKILLSLFSH